MADALTLLQQAGVGSIGKYSLQDTGAKLFDTYKDLFASGKTFSDNLSNLFALGKTQGTNDPMYLQTLTMLAVGNTDAGTQTLAKRQLQKVNDIRSQSGQAVINVAGGVTPKFTESAPVFTQTAPQAPTAPTLAPYYDLSHFQTGGDWRTILGGAYKNLSKEDAYRQYTQIDRPAQVNTYNTQQAAYTTAYSAYQTQLSSYNTAYAQYQTNLSGYQTRLNAFNAEQEALKPINQASDLALGAASSKAEDVLSKIKQQQAEEELIKRAESFQSTLAGLASGFTKNAAQPGTVTPSAVLQRTKLGGTYGK